MAPKTLREKAHAAGYSMDTIHRAKEAINEFVNVQDTGAKGDGVTDDTVAILKAVAVCAREGTVFFPPFNEAGERAIYLISEPITIGGTGGVGKGITLIGSPGQHPIIRQTNNTHDVIRVVPFTPGTNSNQRIAIGHLQLEFGQNSVHWTPNSEPNGNSRLFDLYMREPVHACLYFEQGSPGTSDDHPNMRCIGGQYGLRAQGDQALQNTSWPNFYCAYTTVAAISIEHGEHADGAQSTTSNITFGPYVTLEGNFGTAVFNRNGEVKLVSLHLESNGGNLSPSNTPETPTFVLDSTWDGVSGEGGWIHIEGGNQGGNNPTQGGTKRYLQVLNQGCALTANNMEWKPGTGQTIDFAGFTGVFRSIGVVGDHPAVVNNPAGISQADNGDFLTVNKLRIGGIDAVLQSTGLPYIAAMSDTSQLFAGGLNAPKGTLIISAPANSSLGSGGPYRRFLDSSNGAAANQGWYAFNQVPEGRIELGLTPATTKWVVNLETTDPSTAGGVTANIGSIGLRNNAGTGELWLKTGAANTAWTKVL